jgi:hypothetical protein
VKDATTESLGVPAMAWTFLGLALLARARTTRSPVALGLALVHLLLAAFSRPEAVGLVPLAAAAAWWPVAPGRGPSTADPALQRSIRPALLALAAALLVLRAIQMALAVDVELARGNTPDLVTVEGLRAMVSGLAFRNAAFWPTFFPLVATGLALLGPAVTTGRARVQAAAFLALAILGLAVSQLDLPYVSVPRVQAPALAFLALAAAWGFGGLWAFQRRAFARPRAFAALVAVEAAVVVASCAATVPALWAPTNADDEERLFRDALAALPDEPVTLVRRGYEDPPREPGHLYNPDYLFRPPRRDDRVIGPDRFLRDAPTDRPAYFLLGTRCWLRACGSEGMHPACAGMARRFRLEPVFERDVPVRRLPLDRPPAHPLADLDFGWCTPADAMRIGLYRVLPAGD